MSSKERERLKKMLDRAVTGYLDFRNRDDYPDRPCVRKETSLRQHTVFTLASNLYHFGFITWEDCCQYWCKVDMVGEDTICQFTNCGANIDGKCKYAVERCGGANNG